MIESNVIVISTFFFFLTFTHFATSVFFFLHLHPPGNTQHMFPVFLFSLGSQTVKDTFWYLRD